MRSFTTFISTAAVCLCAGGSLAHAGLDNYKAVLFNNTDRTFQIALVPPPVQGHARGIALTATVQDTRSTSSAAAGSASSPAGPALKRDPLVPGDPSERLAMVLGPFQQVTFDADALDYCEPGTCQSLNLVMTDTAHPGTPVTLRYWATLTDRIIQTNPTENYAVTYRHGGIYPPAGVPAGATFGMVRMPGDFDSQIYIPGLGVERKGPGLGLLPEPDDGAWETMPAELRQELNPSYAPPQAARQTGPAVAPAPTGPAVAPASPAPPPGLLPEPVH